jgi:hypothetical protein
MGFSAGLRKIGYDDVPKETVTALDLDSTLHTTFIS